MKIFLIIGCTLAITLLISVPQLEGCHRCNKKRKHLEMDHTFSATNLFGCGCGGGGGGAKNEELPPDQQQK